MTNKKKQSARHTAASTKQGLPKEDIPGMPEIGPSKPQNFTRPQLACLIIVAVGASKVWEWRNALLEITALTDGVRINNGTDTGSSSSDPTLCEYYMRNDDVVNYDPVCFASETTTMMTLKYDYSVQLLAIVAYILFKCWDRDDLLNRYSGFLSVAPLSTTLLLLQASASYLTRKSQMLLTITIAFLMFLATSGTSMTIREIMYGKLPQSASRRSFQSIGLGSMILLNLYEAVMWFKTCSNSSSSILQLPVEWESAWEVFVYMLMMDKVTFAVMLTYAWLCFDETRQRSILFIFAMVKAYEYAIQMSDYKETDFVDLASMRTTTLTCAVLCGIAGVAPNLHLDYSDLASTHRKENKTTKVE
jgi:hypothetical protein